MHLMQPEEEMQLQESDKTVVKLKRCSVKNHSSVKYPSLQANQYYFLKRGHISL